MCYKNVLFTIQNTAIQKHMSIKGEMKLKEGKDMALK